MRLNCTAHGGALPLTCLVLAAALLVGCGVTTRKYVNPAAQGGLIAASDRVLVLPLRDGSCLPVYGNHVMCHLTGQHLDAGDVPKGTGAEFGATLFEDLRARGASLVPYNLSLQLLSEADPAFVDRYEPALGARLGKQAQATKVIMGVVARYEERSGTRFASGEPAAVAFSLAVVDVATGRVTHKLRVNRRQTALTGNLFALPTWWREGFGWWTRKQVADEALAEAAEGLVGGAGAQPLWRTAGFSVTSMPLARAATADGKRIVWRQLAMIVA
ncbi:MAG: hypothetical protein ACE5I7_07135 [Candidatus Binatia bacterium]